MAPPKLPTTFRDLRREVITHLEQAVAGTGMRVTIRNTDGLSAFIVMKQGRLEVRSVFESEYSKETQDWHVKPRVELWVKSMKPKNTEAAINRVLDEHGVADYPVHNPGSDQYIQHTEPLHLNFTNLRQEEFHIIGHCIYHSIQLCALFHNFEDPA